MPVCGKTYRRIMASLPGNIGAAQLAIAEELRKAGFELDDDNEEMTGSLRRLDTPTVNSHDKLDNASVHSTPTRYQHIIKAPQAFGDF